MPTKSHTRAKYRGARRQPNQRGTASKNGRARCKQAKSSRDSNTKKQRDLRTQFLNTFLQWRDHRSFSKEARAVFNAMADSVADIPREGLQLYLSTEQIFDSRDAYDFFSAAVKETLKSVRDGTFKPKYAAEYACAVLLLSKKNNSVAWMAAIANGDKDQLRAFTKRIVSDRMLAFGTLEEAGLVILHTQPDGLVRLEWPESDHPAAAAYLATIGAPLRLVFDR